MYRSFFSLLLSALRWFLIAIAMGLSGIMAGDVFLNQESDVDADRRWRAEIERRRGWKRVAKR